MKPSIPVRILVSVAALVGLSFYEFGGNEVKMLKPINELRVRISQSIEIPDPAKIQTTGDWYYLDHISSGLAGFDSTKQKFMPILADSWNTGADGSHHFHLKKGLAFHDGTSITVNDVLWTLKRQLLLKTSTHFPLWEYIAGCDKIRSLHDECEGLLAVSDSEIIIRLKRQTDSFFLQLASPETGIWSASDMDPVSGKLTPTKFSGPYFVERVTQSEAVLKRNENSIISKAFLSSPRVLRIKKIPLAELDQALASGALDLVIRGYRPLGEPNWEKLGIHTRATPSTSIIYLHGPGTDAKTRLPIGSDFINLLWNNNPDKLLTSSQAYLPFAKDYALTKEEFLSQLPDKTAPRLRIHCPEVFFPENFLAHLKQVGHEAGTEIEFVTVSGKKWLEAFDDPKASEYSDYILGLYAASERYPAVQLRYITGELVKPAIDLKEAESPDLTSNKLSILKNYEMWLLESRQAIPIYFSSTFFLFRKEIDLGLQPSTDAEIELWRIQEREPSQ